MSDIYCWSPMVFLRAKLKRLCDHSILFNPAFLFPIPLHIYVFQDGPFQTRPGLVTHLLILIFAYS